MLLTENFIKLKSQFDELNKYKIRFEKITNIYYKVFLEYKNISICIDIEENEPYVSFYVTHKIHNKQISYYGLSSYSDLNDEKQSIFQSKSDEEIFISDFKKNINKYRRLLFSDKNGDGIIICVYSFMNDFVKNLRVS